jgi:hypothetical protein
MALAVGKVGSAEMRWEMEGWRRKYPGRARRRGARVLFQEEGCESLEWVSV